MSKTTRPRQQCSECQKEGRDRAGNNLCYFLNKQGNETSKCMREECSYNENKSKYPEQKLINKFKQLPITEEEDLPLLVGDYKDFRGISKNVCELYEYKFVDYYGKSCTAADTKDISGATVCQKLRYLELNAKGKKVFPWLNCRDKLQLWGPEPKNYSHIIITEGYEDAMSCAEAGYYAKSILRGANSAKKDIQDNIEEIKKFEKIILWFDNDEAGKKATKDCLEILPFGKTYIVNCEGWKDANECLTTCPNGKEIIDLMIEQIKEIVPEGIIFGDQFDCNELLIPESEGIPVDFPILNDMIRGIKAGKIIVVAAGTGIGKSTFTKHIIYPWLRDKLQIKIGLFFLEETGKYTKQSLIGMDLNKPVCDFEEDPEGVLGKQNIQTSFNRLLNTPNIAIFDHFGSCSSQKLFEKLYYLADIKKFNVIILDHLSILVSGLDSSKEGERKDIDKLMTKLKQLTKDTGISIIVVTHLNRAQGEKGYEEGKPVTMQSFRSSHAIGQLADVALSVERNTQGNDKDKTKIRVLKNRITGKLGEADEFRYMENTGRYFVTSKEFK